MKEEELNYEKDLEIHKHSLDEECLDQARRFAHWANMRVEAEAHRDRVKQDLLITRAEAEREIRESLLDKERMADYGLVKGTEAEIKGAIDVMKTVRQAEGDLITANERVGFLGVAREAFQQRKSMLEALVSLWLSGYWADPKVNREAREKVGELHQERQGDALKDNPRMRKRIGK